MPNVGTGTIKNKKGQRNCFSDPFWRDPGTCPRGLSFLSYLCKNWL